MGFICLYVSVSFGILFGFFAGIPYTFTKVYNFSLEQSGMVFFSVVIGCMIGFVIIVLSDVLLYRKQLSRFPPNKVPPEYRLYPAMIGSIGLPIGLFWLAWTAKKEISWVSPAIAIIPFAGGNICLFISTLQYIQDTYHGNVIASAASANSLGRYLFSGAFPLFMPKSTLRSRGAAIIITNFLQCLMVWVSTGHIAFLASFPSVCCLSHGFYSNTAPRFGRRVNTRPSTIAKTRNGRNAYCHRRTLL